MQFAEKGFVEIFYQHGIDSMKIKTETGRPNFSKIYCKNKGCTILFHIIHIISVTLKINCYELPN